MGIPLIRASVGGALLLATAMHGSVRHAPVHAAFVPVLIYHHVKTLKPSDDAIERGLTVLPSAFSAQLAYLRHHGYHPVTAARMVAALRAGHGLPRKPVVLSFDDGYTDIYPDVYRVLRREHLTATFFIVPDFLGTPRYLTWGEVEDMSRHGMDIESHTLTHPDLTTLSPARVWREVHGARQLLQQRLKRAVRLFAYPYGTYNAEVLRAVTRAGYLAAFTTREGWEQSSSTLILSPRVYVDLDDTISIFAGRLLANPTILAEDPT